MIRFFIEDVANGTVADDEYKSVRTPGTSKTYCENSKRVGYSQESEVENPVYFGACNKRVSFNDLDTRN